MSTNKQSKRKKTSDKDIKEFFLDYQRAKGRRKFLLSKTLGREMTAKERNEYNQLGLYMECIEQMIETLEPLIKKIVKEYYIDHISLFDISLDINYCYEHVSYLKNLGCDTIRKIISGEDVLQHEQSISILKLVEKTIKNSEAEQRTIKLTILNE